MRGVRRFVVRRGTVRAPEVRRAPTWRPPVTRLSVPPPVATEAMLSWWRTCLIRGSQMEDPEKWRLSYDYRGSGPWKRYVAVDVLMVEFLNHSGLEVDEGQFRHRLSSVTGSPKIISRPGRLERDDGSLFLRPRRRFARFRSLDWHRERFQESFPQIY